MSRKLRGFQTSIVTAGFVDSFNNSSIHSNWTVDIPDVSGTDPTITEDGTGLTIAYDGGNSVALTWATSQAPNISLAVEPNDFMIKTFIDSFSAQNVASAGIVHYLDGDKSKCHNIVIEDGGSDYFETSYNNSNEETTGSPSGECWLVLLRRGYEISFFYSTNAFASEPDLKDMTHIRTIEHAFSYLKNKVALYAESTSATYPAISPRFRKFSLSYSI